MTTETNEHPHDSDKQPELPIPHPDFVDEQNAMYDHEARLRMRAMHAFSTYISEQGFSAENIPREELPQFTKTAHEFVRGVVERTKASRTADARAPLVHSGALERAIEYHFQNVEIAGDQDSVHRARIEETIDKLKEAALDRASVFPEIQLTALLRDVFEATDKEDATHGLDILLAAYGRRFALVTGHIAMRRTTSLIKRGRRAITEATYHYEDGWH